MNVIAMAKINELQFDVLPHLTLSDYYLFPDIGEKCSRISILKKWALLTFIKA